LDAKKAALFATSIPRFSSTEPTAYEGEIVAYENFIEQFLSRLGVESERQVDERGVFIYRVATDAYERRRVQLNAWFEVVQQNEQQTVIKERERGTGKTVL